MERMKISDVKTRAPFEDLFPIKEEVVQAIRKHIESNGYDESTPIVVWKEEGIVVDGHMRLRASQQANLKGIPVVKRTFKNEDEALDYALHNQRDRRNLTDAEITQVVERLDERRKRGRPNNASNVAITGRSSQMTAQKIGTSSRKVEKVRTILDHADEKTKEAVKSGKMTIQEGYRKTQEERNPEKKSVLALTVGEIKSARLILDCKRHCSKCHRPEEVRSFLKVARNLGCKMVPPPDREEGKNEKRPPDRPRA